MSTPEQTPVPGKEALGNSEDPRGFDQLLHMSVGGPLQFLKYKQPFLVKLENTALGGGYVKLKAGQA